MIDRKKIIETFERLEEQSGGIWHLLLAATLDKTAEELGLPRDQVRDVMIDHWAMRGGG